jgi:hypothetical protein
MTPRVLPRGRRRWEARSLALALVVAAASSASCRAPAPPQPPARTPAPWLVTIVVDQLAAWIADERWPALPDSGGFARLRREGLWVRQLRFGHACTDTAPGHSALYTGATPRESGIVANELPGPSGKAVSIVSDPTARLVVAGGGDGGGRPGSSLRPLGGDTVADALRAARPDARVLSFSLKDRGAVFSAGRHPSLVMWLEPELGAFATSTAFATSLPAWVAPFAGPAAVEQARAAPWSPLAGDWLAARSETRDDQPGEGDYDGLGVGFPHRARSTKAERATPAGDDLLFALARAAAAATHAEAQGQPVMLSISLSSNDYVEHVFGPHSWEAWDELLRLDRGLAALLDALDRLVGRDGYAVMLSGDHGSNPLPEVTDAAARTRWCRAGAGDRWERPCTAGSRLRPAEVAAALETAARQALGPEAGAGPWIAGVTEPLVYLTPAGRALPAAVRRRLVEAGAAELRRRYAVADLVDLRTQTGTCPGLEDESIPALVCRSVRAEGPGDFYVVPRPGTFFDPGYAPGHGTSHGSPYLYDRAVPLLVRAPGRVPAGVTRDEPVRFTAFARTAAALLGVPPPAAAGGGEDLTASR